MTNRWWLSSWVLRLYGVLAVFAAVMFWRSAAVGVPVRDPGHEYFVQRPAISFGLAALYIVVWAGWRTLRRHGSFGANLRALATGRRLGLAVLGLVAYQLSYLIYHQLKSWVVFHQPCGGSACDKDLERWDTWLWFGHHPAQVLHDLIGVGWQTHVLVFFYEAFATLCILFVPAYVLVPRIRDAWVAWTALAFTWIGGTASYYLLPSLGPFHQAPGDFADLPQTEVRTTQALYVAQRAHLLADRADPTAFAQIGAFASLHVGISVAFWLIFRYLGMRWSSRLMGLFVLITCVDTVYLGWHFFLDVPAGATIAWAAMWLAKRLIYPGGRATTDPATEPEMAHSAA